MDAVQRLRVLRDNWRECKKCELSKLRGDNRVVFGSGNAGADILLVLPPPTQADVQENMGLSDAAGQLIEDMLMEAGLDPVKDVFRTNVVGCRPYVVLPATEEQEERIQDRKVVKAEVSACSPRVEEIIYLVDPKLILAFGEEAWEALVIPKVRAPETTITAAAGKLYYTYVPGRFRPIRYPVMALEAPLKLVANPSAAAHGPIATTLKYIMQAKKYVDLINKDEAR
jgi:uracil-DNA glycosylase family 4